jgi:phage RecT family recombinase
MADLSTPAPAQSQALTVKDHLAVIKDTLKKTEQNLMTMLPSTLRSREVIARFLEGVQFSVWKNPELALCDRASLIAAVIYCVRMGLEPGAEDGCALVPFRQGNKKVVTPIPQYKGLIKRATETGSVHAVDVMQVYENDKFTWVEGSKPFIEHEPTRLGKPRGEIIGCYAIYSMPDGSKKHHVMSKEDVERIRNMAAAYKAKPEEGPWHDHFWAMGMKTAIRAGFKTIPVNTELRKLLETDARLEGGENLTNIIQEISLNPEEGMPDLPDEALPATPPTQAQKLADAIKVGPEVDGQVASQQDGMIPMNNGEPPTTPIEGGGTKEAGDAADKAAGGPLFDPAFEGRVDAVMKIIEERPVDWRDIAKWVGPSRREEITAANLSNLTAYVNAYDPARAKKTNKAK